MNQNKKEPMNGDFERLVGRLKTEDAGYATISKVLQVVYWIFIPVFSFMSIRQFADSGDVDLLVGGACMVGAFLIFAIFFGKYYKEYRYVDYSLPTLIMLKKAAYRYKPFQLRTLWIALAVVLMDIGLFYDTREKGIELESQLMFLGAILVGLCAGLVLWYNKYKPLRDDALRMISEIEDK